MMNFTKMNGCGNDFIIIDNRYNSINLSTKQIVELADYKRSVGFDQLLLIESTEKADIAIRIFNNDGSEVDACGNGTRCVAKLVMDQLNVSELTIATRVRVLNCSKDGDEISVNMGKATIIQENMQFDQFSGQLVDLSNPHIVIELEQLAEDIILSYGPKIEHDTRFPNKTNVNFVHIINRQLIELRTWERGAGATLSCGSGACASFYALYKARAIDSEVIIRQLGGELKLKMLGEEIYMTGGANICYYGRIIPGTRF